MKTSKQQSQRAPGRDDSSPDEEPKPFSNDPAPAGATAGADADGEDPIAGLQADLDRFRDLALRSQADFDNFKKRAAREKEEAIKFSNSSLLERLIAIVDNFELGLAAAKGDSEQSPIYSGMSMVLKQLTDFLAENGLEPIEAEGQKFDPNLHEAVAQEPSDDVPEGNVVRQMRRGYKLKDRLLRPSAVVVSSGKRAG
jgi:molecular chaperone GrpE